MMDFKVTLTSNSMKQLMNFKRMIVTAILNDFNYSNKVPFFGQIYFHPKMHFAS